MYDVILFPTDGSDAMRGAAEHAYDHAERYDADLHVLYVVRESESAAIVGQQAAVDALDADAEEAMNDAVEGATDRDIEVVSEVRVGTPYREIIDYSGEAGVDLVVMSTHGRSGIGRFFMGSVTERVIRDGSAPVLAVQR